jgi:hypothetical protein
MDRCGERPGATEPCLAAAPPQGGPQRQREQGRRSSKELADHLTSFEQLGLIRRDNARDAIVITNPNDLRRLGDAEAALGESPCPHLPQPHGEGIREVIADLNPLRPDDIERVGNGPSQAPRP